MNINKKHKVVSGILALVFIVSGFFGVVTPTPSTPAHAEESSLLEDYEAYEQYSLYLKFEKKEKYDKYKKYRKPYKKYKEKYKFNSSSERKRAKEIYKKYKADPSGNQHYYDIYKQYKGYKNKYKPAKEKYKKYKKYKKYEKYNKDKYDKYEKYGTAANKAGYNAYRATLRENQTNLGEADLGGGVLGPTISVGLTNYSRSYLKDNSFKITANKPYTIKKKDGTVLGDVAADTETKVKYVSDGNMKVYESIPEVIGGGEVNFVATNPSDDDTIIFDYNKAGTSYDYYRHSMRMRYSPSSKTIWAINILPLEQYVWGMGEITGTGDMDYNRVMTTSYRTYGYWKAKFSTKYASEGFKVNATPGNQLYYGQLWEQEHQRIKDAAIDTQGKIVMYNTEIALTPYSSWTDGRTRSFKERWGSSNYPWCKSVKDPYGKHPSKNTETLEAEGNHMVGLSAHGALSLAGDHDWDWDKILKYYYTGINIVKVY